MNARNVAVILRRHLVAVTLILMTSAGVAYDMKVTPVTYAQSATLVFGVGRSPAEPNLANPLIDPLIATEVTMAQVMDSPAAQSEVRAAGGTAQFQFVPENLYSLQYPYYAQPSATLTATSPSPSAVTRTFTVAAQVLASRLAALQERAGVLPQHRIRTFIAGDTGPVPQPGSPARVFGGLGLLTVVALLMVPIFLERHRMLAGGRPRDRLRERVVRAAPATTGR
jgi:hypothetical protein